MAADDPMMRVRLPPELKSRIAETARAAGRSMNAEIVHRLELSFDPRAMASTLTDVATREFLEVSANHLDKLAGLVEKAGEDENARLLAVVLALGGVKAYEGVLKHREEQAAKAASKKRR